MTLRFAPPALLLMALGLLAAAGLPACDGGPAASSDLGRPDGGIALRSCQTELHFSPGHAVTGVSIGAEWNGFRPEETPLTGPDPTGVYRATISLPVGVYAYKVVTYEGSTPTWQLDPENPYSKFVQGEENSAL